MPNHIQKCRRSHTTLGTTTCRFNVSHVFPVQEKEYHEMRCTDRVLVDMFIQHMVEGDGNEGDEAAVGLVSDDEDKNEIEIASMATSTAVEIVSNNGVKNILNNGEIKSLNMSVPLTSTNIPNDTNWDDVSLKNCLEYFRCKGFYFIRALNRRTIQCEQLRNARKRRR